MKKNKEKTNAIRSLRTLPTLLFWQYMVLALCIGIIATRFKELAFFLALFLALFMLHLSDKNGGFGYQKHANDKTTEEEKAGKFSLASPWKSISFMVRMGILFLCMFLSFFYTVWREPTLNREAEKTWGEFNDPMQYMYIKAKIQSVQGLPSGRLRLILKDTQVLGDYPITPKNKPYKVDNHAKSFLENTKQTPQKNVLQNRLQSSLESLSPNSLENISPNTFAPPLPSLLNFTWDRSPFFERRPISGETLIVRTRIRKIYGSISNYWKDKNIWYNAWLYGNKDIYLTGEASFLAQMRETLRYNFVRNVFLPVEIHDAQNTEIANTATDTARQDSIIHSGKRNASYIEDNKNLSGKETSEINISANNLSANNLSANNLSAKEISEKNGATKNLYASDISGEKQSAINISTKEMASTKMQARAILPALLFGDRFYLTSQSLELFNGANLLHSLALSGQHLALTGFLAALLIGLLISARPSLLLHTSRRKYLFYSTIPLALAYLFLGSAPLSLLRAFIMLALAGFLWIKAKVFTLLDSLFLALLCFCIWRPTALFDLGVQLSFVSVFTIAFFMPIMHSIHKLFQDSFQRNLHLTKIIQMKKKRSTRKSSSVPSVSSLSSVPPASTVSIAFSLKDFFSLERFLSSKIFSSLQVFLLLQILALQRLSIKTLRVLCSLMSISFLIQICTMPFIIAYFGKISYFFLLNVIWLPVLGFLVLPFSAFALLFSSFPTLAQFCIEIAAYPAYILIELLTWFKSKGFDPFLQSLKPSVFSMLGLYVIILFSCYRRSILSYVNKQNLSPPHISLFKKPLVLLFLMGICLLFSSPFERYFLPTSPLNLTLLDVGQGQAVLIEGKKGRILIDTGGANSPRFNVGRDIVAHYLTENKAPRLNALIASHDDADHINGFGHLLNSFSIQNFMESYLPREKASSVRKKIDKILRQTKTPITKLGMGDVIDMGDGFYLQVLYPPYSENPTSPKNPTDTVATPYPAHTSHTPYKPDSAKLLNALKPIPSKNAIPPSKAHARAKEHYSSNNSSLVLRLVKDGKGLALLCGDVEKSGINDLLRFQKKNMWTYNTKSPHNVNHHKDALLDWSLEAEILVLPHHGSKNSFSPAFYKAVNPKTILASAGRYNRFGFPALSIQNYFVKENKKVLSTNKEGNIEFQWNGVSLVPLF